MTPTLDTHAAFVQLEKAGIESAHAEAIVDVVARSEEALVTKADLDAAIAALETRLVKWMFVTALGAVGLGVAALGILLSVLLT